MSANCTKILFTLVAGVFITVFQVPVVHAQDELTLEEIIVTARKREESLLDVPLSISAFSADKIETMALNHLVDLVAFSPGFYYAEHSVGRGAREHRRLVFRGMQPRTDIQTRQGATVFIDGAPTMGSEIGAIENYERVEIIKGPQSAYFGRSTFSGAINAVTKTPGNEWRGQVSAEAGRFELSRFRAQVEGPLLPDKAAFRISASTYSKGGEYKNAINPTQEFGKRDTDDIAGTLYLTPTDNLSIKLRAHFWRDSDGPDIGVVYGPDNNPGAFNCNEGGQDWICGVPPQPTREQIAKDVNYNDLVRGAFANPGLTQFFIVDEVPDGFGLERNAHELTGIVNYEFGNGMSFQSITARHENEYATLNDVDGRPTVGLGIGDLFGICIFGPQFCDTESYQMLTTHLEDFHQEIHINSAEDQRLRWMIGGTYSDREQILMTMNYVIGFRPNPASASSIQLLNYESETIAVFGSLAFDVTDQLTLNLEMRYQEDEITEGRTTADRLSPQFELTDTFDSFNPRAIIEWKPIEGTMFYASYAEGSNPGQFNAGLIGLTEAELASIKSASGSDTSVPEEDLTMYEVGVKSSLLESRVQVSLTGYYGDWTNVQAPGAVTYTDASGMPAIIQANTGGGDADLWGIEFEGLALLTEHLSADATFAWNKTEINKLDSGDAAELLGNQDISGLDKEFSRYPETSGTIGLAYTDQLLNTNYNWFGRVDYLYRGSTWMSNANITKTGVSHTFNLRAGVEHENWRFEVYGTNIFNEKSFTNLQALFDLSGISGEPFAGDKSEGRALAGSLTPRPAYGARISYRF